MFILRWLFFMQILSQKKREQLMTRNKFKNQKVINTIKIDEKIANDVIGSDDSVGDDFRLSG